jgi:hypothetical protein
MADAPQGGRHIQPLGKLQNKEIICPTDDFGAYRRVLIFAAGLDCIEDQSSAWLRRLASSNLRQQPIAFQQSFDQYFYPAARLFMAVQACRDDPGIVEYQQIIRPQQIYQAVEDSMLDSTRLRIQAQQSTVTAFFHRIVSDQLIG